MPPVPPDVTRLIQQVQAGDASAREDLWHLVYDELRLLAGHQMKRERVGHTLQPTALVHEVWLRLGQPVGEASQSRAHFFGIAAEAMRRILIEHARKRGAARRGGGAQRRSLEDSTIARLESGAVVGLTDEHEDLEVIDEALQRLEAQSGHERKCQVVKLRFFVGLTVEQTADVLGLSEATVKRDWDFAKAWLAREVARARHESASNTPVGAPRPVRGDTP